MRCIAQVLPADLLPERISSVQRPSRSSRLLKTLALQLIRAVVDEALNVLSEEFDRLCARIELEGFATVMEIFRNNGAGLRDLAIAGLRDYEQIPALDERGGQRVANFYADFGLILSLGTDRYHTAQIRCVLSRSSFARP